MTTPFRSLLPSGFHRLVVEAGFDDRRCVVAARFREALKAAGIKGHVRPWHDLRHTAITNDAAAGSSELAVMARAGHRSMSTTKTYLHLAGVVFRDEADALERRLLTSAY